MLINGIYVKSNLWYSLTIERHTKSIQECFMILTCANFELQ
jgi:hypothetical protein